MFSFLSNSAKEGQQPSTVLIKEANEHVRQMHGRILDLEKRVREQCELLERRDFEYQDQLARMRAAKDADLANYRRQLDKAEQRRRQLEDVIREKDVQVAYLMHRCSFLDEAASYAPLIEQLAQCLKTSLAAPPPKVHSVRPQTSAAAGADVSHRRLAAVSEELEEAAHKDQQQFTGC